MLHNGAVMTQGTSFIKRTSTITVSCLQYTCVYEINVLCNLSKLDQYCAVFIEKGNNE
jgi:hypothetical protein